jgi:DNA-directed RNA polymerase specialized sigma24 family protein
LRALAYSPDDSYVEVSTALGMPVGSIGPTRSRCLQHLRRELVAGGALAEGEGRL